LKHLFTLNRYLVKYKWHIVSGIVFVFASNYFGILIPQKIREALDLVQGQIQLLRSSAPDAKDDLYGELSHTLFIFGLTVTGFVMLKGVLMYFMRQTIIVMSRLIEYDMRQELYQHLQTLDQTYFRTRQTGDLMARISEDVSKVRNYVGPGILYAINLVSLFVLTIGAMFKVDVFLSICVLGPLPILSISIYYVSNMINVRSTKIQQQLAVLNNTAQETYSGIRVIKSYVKEDQFGGFFRAESDEFMTRSLSLAKVEAYFQPLMVLLISISTLIVVIVGGYQVFQGKLTTGNIAEFILYVNMLTWPVTAIGWIASTVQEAEASQARINEVLHQQPTIVNSNHEQYTLRGDISFSNVTFTYPNTGITAIKNLSFDLKKGQKMAIMGKTASGKTTIAELLTRMFDVDSGEILIDGKNIKEHNLDILRTQMAYIPQDVFLFSDTVADNISFGESQTTQESIEKYARLAAVHDDIMKLPKQYDTLVGERGVTLSGGQKQRIAIARSFIKNPQIMLLDDTLSAVDTNTEKQIMEYFTDALASKTAILVTHRANNLLDYDKIIVIDNGEIVEQGTHAELVANGGFYARIYEQQELV